MSIRLRLFLGILLVTGVGFYALLDWVVKDLNQQYREATEEPMIDAARVLAVLAAQTAVDGRLDHALFRRVFTDVYAHTFESYIYAFVKTHVDFRLYMTDATGRVVFDSDFDATLGRGRAEGQDYSQMRDVQRTLRGLYGARTSRTDADDPLSSVMYVAAPILLHGETIGVLAVGKPVLNVMELTQEARRKVLLVGTGIGLTVMTVGLVIAGMILRPIRRLTAYAQAVRDGRRVTLPSLGRSEIRTLGEAFEEMRDALEGKQYVERYVQTLTHEIKSPLAAIQGAAALLHEDMPPEQRARFVHNIQSEAQRLHTLVEKMLLLAALENRKAILDVEMIPLAELLHEVQDSLLPLLTTQELTLTLRGALDTVLPGERFFVRQAVLNLLHNAIEFTPRGGWMTLSVERDETTATLVVQDSGPGIPAYALGRVFERFYSLPRPDTGKKSSGLGLSLVQEVAALHGGAVTLANAPEGGAVARLALPLTHLPGGAQGGRNPLP